MTTVEFGLNEVAYVLVRMVQKYRTIKSEDSGDWVEGDGIALESKNGVKVTLRRD
jgi:predicted lipid-binding transport protein (Tim44 family)